MPSFRSAQTSDIAAVLQLWSEAAAEPSHTDDEASLRALIDINASALIVAEDGDRIVATIIAAWDGWRGSIYRLVVTPSHRRRGLARRLLRAAESRLSDAGATRVQAIVVETEEPALGFWQASGWDQQVARLRFVKG